MKPAGMNLQVLFSQQFWVQRRLEIEPSSQSSLGPTIPSSQVVEMTMEVPRTTEDAATLELAATTELAATKELPATMELAAAGEADTPAGEDAATTEDCAAPFTVIDPNIPSEK